MSVTNKEVVAAVRDWFPQDPDLLASEREQKELEESISVDQSPPASPPQARTHDSSLVQPDQKLLPPKDQELVDFLAELAAYAR